MSKRGFSALGCAAVMAVATLAATGTVQAQHHHHYVNPTYQYGGHTHGHYHQNYYAQDQHYHVYSSPMVYAARTHVDTLAIDLKYAANRIAWDMYENYTSNPGYRDTYREAYKMLQDAKHIYTLVYDEQYHLHQHPGGVDHIATDLRDISALYQHIQQDIARWSPTVYNPYHDAGLLHAKMQKFGEVLNHIMADYGIQAPVSTGPAAPTGPTTQIDPPAPSAGPTPGFAPSAPFSGGAPAAPSFSSPQPQSLNSSLDVPPNVVAPNTPGVAP
jgi:hypothetical protein